jgi:hypothetical protein
VATQTGLENTHQGLRNGASFEIKGAGDDGHSLDAMVADYKSFCVSKPEDTEVRTPLKGIRSQIQYLT